MKTISKYLVFLVWFTISTPGHANSIETNGDILVVLIPGAAYASTFYKKDVAGRNEFYKSFVSTAIATHGLKILVHKQRPDGSDYLSFPSGHTSAAFQGASFIHRRYGLKQAILPYVAATYVGYTRVEANKHDWTDVSAGALLGIASNWLFTTRRPNQSFSLYKDGDRLGFRFSVAFR
ncbi:MAG: phosphatase PAP2 family protein [Acidiferrobacterales bacterium]